MTPSELPPILAHVGPVRVLSRLPLVEAVAQWRQAIAQKESVSFCEKAPAYYQLGKVANISGHSSLLDDDFW